LARFGSGNFEVIAPLNAGQVYTTLQRLQRDELVADDAVAQSGRPDKRVYRLTEAGREALQEWLGATSAPTKLRDDFFMKLVLAHSMGPAA
jgi:DNA-binding PadR family transcriptional regulator